MKTLKRSRNTRRIPILLALLITPLFAAYAKTESSPQHLPESQVNLRTWGVEPGGDPHKNAANLQKAIDWASPRGGVLWLEPSDTPYPVAGGIVLKMNVSLVGGNGAVPRGTAHPERDHPVGSVFSITDKENAFLTVEGATRVEGIQFYYPEQTRSDPKAIIPYPATIRKDPKQKVQGVTLSRLTFYGEYLSMDFAAERGQNVELITIEHCYGYPLSGQFIRIDYCYDIPRILNCHVNPAIQRYFNREDPRLSRAVIAAVIAHKTFAFAINHTDNAQLIDIFTFATYGGIHLGPATYGQLTNFNLDCVTVGIWKQGDSTKNRNWQIAQGSIIANVGERVEDIHPIIIEGQGHTAFTNVEAFSGGNGALDTLDISQDFMLIRGNKKLTVSLVGCRMRNYRADQPITLENPAASVRLVACLDKDENWIDTTLP